MSDALEYHRATNVPALGTDEDEARMVGERPQPFHDYGDAERLPLDVSVAGPLLQDGAGIVRSQEGRDYDGGTIHWRAYSSAGGLFPVEAYAVTRDAVLSFDALGRSFVRVVDGDKRDQIARAVALRELADAPAIVALTGIHARTGWKYMERGYRHIWWDAGTMLANLLALAAADHLHPRLYTGFVDREVNDALGVDGVTEYALALLVLRGPETDGRESGATTQLGAEQGKRFPLAEAAHAASSLEDPDAVGAWRKEVDDDEPRLSRGELADAMRRRRSVRRYSERPLPRDEVADLLAWSEAAIPADAPSVVHQWVTVNAVEELEPGIYDARLNLVRRVADDELRERSGFAAMEQDHPRLAALNVWQMADVEDVVERLGDRGYRWAQLEAGIRAGRLQIGAFMHGWGAAASTFFDEEVSRLLGTHEAPMLMVAIGARG